MIQSNQKMTGKPLAVVTGASSGIGRELAKQFAQNGFNLLITSTCSAIENAARECEALGAKVKTVQADLAKEGGVDILYLAIKETGPVDAIAINAGVGVGGAPFAETDLAAELNMIALNVTSTVHLAKYIVKDMVARGRGRILITSSIAAMMPGPFEAVYAATKAFDLSFAEALRSELKDKGVTVTALMPGPTNTNFFHRAGMENTKAGTQDKYDNDPVDVARQGFKALMQGDDHVVAASIKTKVQGVVASLLPQPAKAAMHRNSTEPGSARKTA